MRGYPTPNSRNTVWEAAKEKSKPGVQFPEHRTLCVFDPKTERARLWLPRMGELADTGFRNFKDIDRIIVMEVRESKRQ